jgi:hypothetical protein
MVEVTANAAAGIIKDSVEQVLTTSRVVEELQKILKDYNQK